MSCPGWGPALPPEQTGEAPALRPQNKSQVATKAFASLLLALSPRKGEGARRPDAGQRAAPGGRRAQRQAPGVSAGSVTGETTTWVQRASVPPVSRWGAPRFWGDAAGSALRGGPDPGAVRQRPRPRGASIPPPIGRVLRVRIIPCSQEKREAVMARTTVRTEFQRGGCPQIGVHLKGVVAFPPEGGEIWGLSLNKTGSWI